jgi:hypothetical protein
MTTEVQSSNTVMLVRPARFGFHAEAAASNVFASASEDSDVSKRALAEFDDLVQRLTDAGIELLFLEDQPEPARPDAIFPNNWVSFHADGTMVLYPMATEGRRLERNIEGLQALLASSGFDVRRVVDLTFHEKHGRFLEGTGSLVLDRPGRRAFANLSPRTDPHVIADFDDRLDYSTLVFDAHDRSGRPIYHTNVMMSFGTRFAVMCPDTLSDEYRPVLIDEIEGSGRKVIEVDYDQLRSFACNLIELRKNDGQPVIALSSAAQAAFRPDQLRQLESFGEVLDVSIPTIEAVGGGSVRCMITDIHLPRITPAP